MKVNLAVAAAVDSSQISHLGCKHILWTHEASNLLPRANHAVSSIAALVLRLTRPVLIFILATIRAT